MRVGPHVVQLLAQECSTDVLSKGGHPGRAGHPFSKAGLPERGEVGLGSRRGEGPRRLGA